MTSPVISAGQQTRLRCLAEDVLALPATQRMRAFLQHASALVGRSDVVMVTQRPSSRLQHFLRDRAQQSRIVRSRKAIFKRPELADDPLWRSQGFAIKDCLLMRIAFTGVHTMAAFVRDDRRYTRTEVALLELFFLECSPSLGARSIGKALPPRLLKVLKLYAQGASTAQAARRLRLSPHTVNDYRKALFLHFGVHSRHQLLSSPAVRVEGMRRDIPIMSPASATVLHFLCGGLSEKEIAFELGCSVNSVHDRTRRLYRQFGAANRAALIACYYGYSPKVRGALGLPLPSKPISLLSGHRRSR